jgi:integrase
MRLALTDLGIRKLPHPPSGQVRYFDTNLPAFGLTVGTRTKTFIVVRGRARKLTTIGRYPDISLQDARREAKRLLAEEDAPKATKHLPDAVSAFLADVKPSVRPKTYEQYAHYLKNPPTIDLADLTKNHVGELTAHRTAAWKVFANWCVRNELTDRNPFSHTPVSYGQRSRVLTDEEVATIMAYDAPPFSHILKLCLLTGQRKGEVTQFCPEWIKGDTITIPAAIAKNGHEHTIPFNLLTARYLREYQHQSFNGFSKAKGRFDATHPMPHWTIHDLRRTFATIHARLGTPIHVVEAMLNHRSGTVSGVAAIYIRHSFLNEARTAALKYEQFIAKLIGA